LISEAAAAAAPLQPLMFSAAFRAAARYAELLRAAGVPCASARARRAAQRAMMLPRSPRNATDAGHDTPAQPPLRQQ